METKVSESHHWPALLNPYAIFTKLKSALALSFNNNPAFPVISFPAILFAMNSILDSSELNVSASAVEAPGTIVCLYAWSNGMPTASSHFGKRAAAVLYPLFTLSIVLLKSAVTLARGVR